MNLIRDEFSPEEYASFWGGDPQYCHAPQLPKDGYMFYNFGSDQQERTIEWLTEFKEAITRLITLTAEKSLFIPYNQTSLDELSKIDLDIEGLTQLKTHVEELIAKK